MITEKLQKMKDLLKKNSFLILFFLGTFANAQIIENDFNEFKVDTTNYTLPVDEKFVNSFSSSKVNVSDKFWIEVNKESSIYKIKDFECHIFRPILKRKLSNGIVVFFIYHYDKILKHEAINIFVFKNKVCVNTMNIYLNEFSKEEYKLSSISLIEDDSIYLIDINKGVINECIIDSDGFFYSP